MVDDEMNVGLFLRFTDILQTIEEGTSDQHEASFAVGKLLKEIYIDSALRRDKHQKPQSKKKCKKRKHRISWKQYKAKYISENEIQSDEKTEVIKKIQAAAEKKIEKIDNP